MQDTFAQIFHKMQDTFAQIFHKMQDTGFKGMAILFRQ